MKKYVVLVMAAIAFLFTFESSEAQVLQRFRNNIREAISPQALPQRQVQPYNYAPPQVRPQSGISNQPRYVQPQVRVQRPAPQPTSSPQRLTPYSQLPPQQRVAIPQQRMAIPPQQLSNGPRLNAPVPVGKPAVGPAGEAKVRVVTYLDPRSGRTYQRRYLLPGNSPAAINRPTQGQVTTGRRSIFTQPTATYGTVAGNSSTVSTPQPVPPAGQSLIPPIQFSPRSTQQPANVSSGVLPALTGPVLSAPSSPAQPIAASIDSFDTSSQVETASSQVETASAEIEIAPSMPETTSAGIPDLSGITVDPAPVAPDEEASQDLFFDDGSTDEEADTPSEEIAEGLNYSVLEEFEEE